MKKVLGTILFVVYAIIAITVTVLLLSYNDYNNSQIGGYTIYIVADDSLEPTYKQGSILLIKETNDRNVQVGDEIFMYKVLNSSEYEVISTTLQGKTQQGSHTVYIVDNEERYASEYFIGKVEDTIVIEGWGYILGLLESRWGYLFCIVVVSLLLFLQEAFELVMEIKYLNKLKKKQAIEVETEDDEEYEYEDDDEDEEEEEEERVVKAKPARTTKKSSTKTATKSSASSKTSSTKKAGTTRKTGSITKSAATRTSTTKAGTTRKTATATSKTRATKSSKEEK